ncbi:glycerate kinase [Paenibacillus sp. SYP-B4298]|uniref:glycerate kinase n=1 Tax=Paenibacillus sp. SYP-B4298 TaxID=2996034 RepID=UPI0022DDBE8D|nr:glycerate kinase [Paenibacillus sp. SYP-B4298]
MRIVIAPDSFKGSLSAREAGRAIERGVQRGLPGCEVIVLPMADGGEGTMEALVEATQGSYIESVVMDPLGREIQASFGIMGDRKTAVIELAESSGLYRITEKERNPLRTTTYGFGQLILAALDRGCRQFILGLGGSATNDGGAGMLQALGVELLDGTGQPIGSGGGELSRLADIRVGGMDRRIRESRFLVACDVDHPLVGRAGASAVFGPQKGATPAMVEQLDGNLRHYADLIERTQGIAIHQMAGAGAAGGLCGGILAFLPAQVEAGVELVSRRLGLEEAIRGADLVITGEGRVDAQTRHGKVPCGVARLARRHGVPAIVLAGTVGDGAETLYAEGIDAIFSIVNRPMTLQEAMACAIPLLEQAAEQAIRLFETGRHAGGRCG